MILDSISQAERYYALHPMFEQAFSFFIENVDILPLGRTDIDGDRLYITIADTEMRSKEDAFLEAHDRYIDIQIAIKGEEIIGWRNRNRCFSEQADYDHQKDIILFYNDTPDCYPKMNSGEFMVFFPTDAHAPLVGSGNIKKAVIKVLL